jgi:hypothetical protein
VTAGFATGTVTDTIRIRHQVSHAKQAVPERTRNGFLVSEDAPRPLSCLPAGGTFNTPTQSKPNRRWLRQNSSRNCPSAVLPIIARSQGSAFGLHLAALRFPLVDAPQIGHASSALRTAVTFLAWVASLKRADPISIRI